MVQKKGRKSQKRKVVSKRKEQSKTMFYEPAHHARYGAIVEITSVPEAKLSVKKLEKEFGGAKTRAKRVRIKRSAVLASNRARASARKRNLKRGTKKRLIKVADIYQKSYEQMDINA